MPGTFFEVSTVIIPILQTRKVEHKGTVIFYISRPAP